MESLGRSYSCGQFVHSAVNVVDIIRLIREMFACACRRLRIAVKASPGAETRLHIN